MRILLRKTPIVILAACLVLTLGGVVLGASKKPRFSTKKVLVLEGKSTKLTIKNKPKGAKLTYSTKNKKIATIDKKGRLRGKSMGETRVTCSVKTSRKTYRLKCNATVVKGAKSVALADGKGAKITNASLRLGERLELKAILSPAKSNDQITWTSSKKAVATVTKDGSVKAVGAGTSKVTATALSKKKASLTVNVTESDLSLKDAYAKHSIKIGAAINGTSSNNTLAESPQMQALMSKHFNSTTFSNLMKPEYLLDRKQSQANSASGNDTPALTFSGIDPGMKYCQANGVGMRGHVLVWHVQTPDWFFCRGYDDANEFVDKETLRNRMESYIRQVVEYCDSNYPGVIYAWDVVNEAIEDGGTYRQSNWFKIYGGADYIADAFHFARKYAAPSVKLFYNDYNTFITKKTEAIIQTIRPIKAAGNLDGVGMQGYINANWPGVRTGNPNVRDAMLLFAKEGLEIHLTELTIRVPNVNEVKEADYVNQAAKYKDLMQTVVELKSSGQANITSVTFFGLMDDHYYHFSGNPLTSPGQDDFTRLFDRDLLPKPAFYSILDAAR